MTIDLSGRRALLFLPASNPRAIAKARGSAADLVILDLEDAVKDADKDTAREAAVAALDDDWPMPVAIRVNGVGTPWYDDDIIAVRGSTCALVVLPSVGDAIETVGTRNACQRPVISMIESATGVLAAPAIARESCGLFLGLNDLAADLRLPAGIDRTSMMVALQSVILAARAAKIAVFDGVYNRLDDPDGFAAECAEARRLGFDGKTLIHPDQIAPCLAAFAPSEAEITRAQRLVAAASGGAERFEGEMIETMHVKSAKLLLSRL